MQNFPCREGELCNPILLECGHTRCSLSPSNLNETECEDCINNTITRFHESPSIIQDHRLCDHCGQNFNSIVEYENHDKKGKCPLEQYGCKEQIDSCSSKEHYHSSGHIDALKSSFEQCISSGNNDNLIKDLTKYLSRNVHMTNENGKNDQLVINVNYSPTRDEIEDLDQNSQLRKKEEQEILNDQFVRNQETEMFIQSELNQLPKQDNQSIQEKRLTSMTDNQICENCQEEYSILLTHVCHRSDKELLEKLKTLSLENEEMKKKYNCLISSNEYLNMNKYSLEIELDDKPDSKNGLLIWPVDKISNKIDESYNLVFSYLDSPRFVSLTGGHQLNVRLFLYGDSINNRSFISLYIILNRAGYPDISIPATFCLVDQTNNHRHVFQRTHVNLNPYEVGIAQGFPRFFLSTNVHQADSPFIKDDILYIIVKLHENEQNKWSDYPSFIQNALERIHT